MTADAEGNDLEKVFIPVTGFLAVQLTGEPTWVDPTEGSATPLVLPEGYVKVGLFKQDGGPQDGGDKEDDLEFFQEGYKLGGSKSRTLQVTLAEFNDIVRQLTTGKTPDTNGMIVVDGDNDATFPMFEVLKGKNGMSLRRNGLGRIQTVEPDQSTRGETSGNAVTFDWIRNDEWGGFYREWLVAPNTPKKLTSVAVTSETGGTLPTNLKAGATLKLGAKATYTDGTNGMVTTQATFTSLDKTIATVSGSTLTLIKAGTAKVTATVNKVTSATASITVAAAA